MYFAFEESEAEIVRNMSSVGIDLRHWVDAGLLQFQCFRPSLLGLEAHLFAMQKFVDEFDPAVVVMDPVSDFVRIGTAADVSAMLTRQVDFLKARGVTALFTSVNSDVEAAQAEQQIGSLVDTWLVVKTMEGNGEHNRVLSVRKSRGHGPLQSDPRVPPHRRGDRAGRRLHRAGWRAHGLGSPGTRSQGAQRRSRAGRRSRTAPGQSETAT